MSTTQNIYDDGVDKSVHTYDVSMKRFFEMFQFVVVEVNRLESFLEKFGIDDVMSLRLFFVFFPKIEYILSIFSKENQHHGDDNPDDHSKKNDKCSHMLRLPNKYRYTINIVASIKYKVSRLISIEYIF